jgi:hypothetical protein
LIIPRTQRILRTASKEHIMRKLAIAISTVATALMAALMAATPAGAASIREA